MKKRLLSMLLALALGAGMLPAFPMPVEAYDMGRKGYQPSISSCGFHTAAITSDGSLYTWGENDDGQLGDGTTTKRLTPVKVMDNVVAVSAGYVHTAAITSDGSLYTWGSNDGGRLGDGTTTERLTPIKVMENVVAVSAGDEHTAAITSDGSLYTWGKNYGGQLGEGTRADFHTPVKVIDNVVAVSAGGVHTAAITSDGSLYTWGGNDDGQLGDGTTTKRLTPIKVMENVVAVSAGGAHTAAITSDGSLYIWGWNGNGQLGDGTYLSHDTPIKMMENVVAVSAGDDHTAAITSDGSLYTWGNNFYGELGDGTATARVTPVRVLENVIAVSTGYRHTAALTFDGSLYTWGEEYSGQLGYVTENYRQSYRPVKVMENIKIPGGGTNVPVNKETYYISFSPSGGAGSMAPVELSGEEDLELPACAFTPPSAKRFKAWSINGTEYQPGDSYHFTGDTTVIAVWESKPFNEYIYRADYMSNLENSAAYTTNGYKSISTPAKSLVESGRKNGLETTLQVWKYVTGGMDAVGNPLSLVDVPLEYKDIYSAIIMDMLEASTSVEYLNKQYLKGIKDSKQFVSSVNTVIKESMYLDLGSGVGNFKELYQALTPEKRKEFRELVSEFTKDWFNQEHPDLARLESQLDLKNMTGGLSDLLDYVGTAEDFYETYLSTVILANQCQKYKNVINEAYQQSLQSGNLYLRAALWDCKRVIDDGADNFIRQLVAGEAVALGKAAVKFLFKEKFWTNVKVDYMAANPGAALILAAYAGSKLAANALFNTDGIKRQFSGLQAMIEIEDLFFRVNDNLRTNYLNSPTEENARDFVYSIDFVYHALNQDCIQSRKFVDAVEKGGGVNVLISGNKSYEDTRKTIKGLQTTYSESYSYAQYEWINNLSEDYPGTGLEEYYLDYYQTDPYVKVLKEIRAACPVDIYIYHSDGTLAASVVEGVVYCTDDNIMIVRQGDEKMVRFFGNEDYSIEYRGSDLGEMDVSVVEYDENEGIDRKLEYYEVPLTDTTVFSMEDTNYALRDKKSNQVRKDVDTNTSSTHVLSVDCGRIDVNGNLLSESEIVSGEKVKLVATIPSGFSFVRWEANHSRVVFSESTSPSTSFTMPDEDVEISAVLLMDDNLITDMDFQASAAGDSISVHIHNNQKAAVYCALYDNLGRIVKIYGSESQNAGNNEVLFPVLVTGVAEARIFVVASDGTPLCASKMLLLK